MSALPANPMLPWLGLGLAANADGRSPPHPYRLLEAAPGAFDYVEYSAPLSLAQARQEGPLFEELLARRAEVPCLFHPVHLNLWGPELEPDGALQALGEHLRAVGSPWVSNDVAWWHAGGRELPGFLYLAPPFSEQGVAACAAHALAVQARCPVPLLLENPAVIALRGPLPMADFMAALQRETGLDLLLDLGHWLSYQLSAGLPPEEGLERLPLANVVELHLAGGVIRRRGGRAFYADDHTQPVPEVLFGLLEAVLPRCPRLRAVTYEADGHPQAMARLTLQRLRALIPRQERPPIPAATPRARTAPAPLEGAWAVYDEAFGRAPAQDGPGTQEERSLRLAVLAQRLDQDAPWSRALCAGTTEALEGFARSDELRAQFGPAGRPLDETFAAWARKAALAARDEAAAAVLAFEAWARSLLAQAQLRGQAVGEGTFPVDLTELLHGAAAARRHAAGRAWTSPLELDVPALREVVLRAPRAPWRVRVDRQAGALRVAAL